MKRSRFWTLLIVPIALACNDATAPRLAKSRPTLGALSRDVVVGSDAQFVSGGTCGAPSGAQANGVAIDESGRMALNVQYSGSGTFFLAFACLNEGFNSIKLFTPPNTTSRVLGMNDSKWLVGDIIGPNFRAVVWRPDNTLLELTPALGDAPRSRATAINNKGDVVGVVEDASGLSPQPFIAHIDLTSGTVASVDFLGGFEGLGATVLTPTAINENGQVVGVYSISTPTTATNHGFLWEAGVVTDLSSQIARPGVANVSVTDINNHGQIVGYYDDMHTRWPALWENGHVTELPPVDPSFPQNDFAQAINDAGVIVGFGRGGALVWKDGQVSSIGNDAAHDINESNQVAGQALIEQNLEFVAIRWNRIAFSHSPVPMFVPSSKDVSEGTEVVFDASTTTDPDGDAIAQYAWDFGDGTSLTTTDPVVRHTFADNLPLLADGTPDSYKVSLQVRDVWGATATRVQPIVVRNAAPVPDAGPDRTVLVGEKFNVTIVSTDPGTSDQPWTFSVSIDGAQPPAAVKGPSKGSSSVDFSWGFDVAGVHTLAFVVTDKDGAQGRTTLTINALQPNQPPVANAGGPYAALEGSDVAFNGSASTDPDGDAITYDWDFGDGTAHSNQPSPHHTYADDGARTVTLVVTDAKGASSTTTTGVTVSNVAPTIAPLGGATLIAGESYSVSGSFTDPGADTWSATVDYGTGTGPQPLALSGQAFNLANTYLVAGTYTVTVSVDDGDGGITRTSATITVQSPSQAAQAATATITSLVTAGALAASEASTLNASLLAASATLARGNTTAGINQLRAFQNKVDAMLGSGRISAVTAQTLKDAAQRIINQV
jgi:probable HAF family extracellular repeat protein